MNQIAASKKFSLRSVFIGPDGLRALWGIVIFVAVFAAIMVGTSLLFHIKKPAGVITYEFGYVAESCQIVALLIAMAVMGKIEGKSLWSYGLDGSRNLAKFVLGWVSGFVLLSALIGLLYATGYLVFDGLALQGLSIPSNGLIWLVGFMLVGAAEELTLRGYLQNTLVRGIGKWPAFIVLSLVFAAMHSQNNGESMIGLVAVLSAGMLFCILRWQSGSLWLGIGLHAAWDWGQSFFYGTADSGLMVEGHLMNSHPAGNVTFSGGTVGPEGSVLAQPILLVGLLLLIWICRRYKLN